MGELPQGGRAQAHGRDHDAPERGITTTYDFFRTTERGWIGAGGGPVGDFLLSGLRVCFRTSVLLLPLLFHFLFIPVIPYGLQAV